MVIRDDHSALGQFVYPPVDNTLTFNYRDTINVSWTTTFDAHSFCFLTLWYWPEAEPWTLSLNSSVSLNGSKTVDLAVAPTSYLGQFNINFAFDNGSGAKYLSEIFQVEHDSSQAPLTWPAYATSQASLKPGPSTTAVSTLSSFQPNASPSSQPQSSPSPQPSSTHSSTTQASVLKTGAIVGISVGSILGLSILIVAATLFIRRSRRNGKRSQASSNGLPKPHELAGRVEGWREPRELFAKKTAPRELSSGQMAPSELPSGQMALRELPTA